MSKYKYFNGSEVYIYPSANASDGGNVNTEKNIASIIDGLVSSNYVISLKSKDPTREHESLEVSVGDVGLNPLEFKLYSGAVVIDGRRIDLEFPEGYITLNLTDLSDSLENRMYLMIVSFYNSTGNIKGDSYTKEDSSISRQNKGVALEVVPASKIGNYDKSSINLGYFLLESLGTITTFVQNRSNLSNDKVKQIKIRSSGGNTDFKMLFTPTNPMDGQSDIVTYNDALYFDGLDVCFKNTPLKLIGSTLIFDDPRFYNSEIYIDSTGNCRPTKLIVNETTYVNATNTITITWVQTNSVVTLNTSLIGNVSGSLVSYTYTSGTKLPEPRNNTGLGIGIGTNGGALSPVYITPDTIVVPDNTAVGCYSTSYVI